MLSWQHRHELIERDHQSYMVDLFLFFRHNLFLLVFYCFCLFDQCHFQLGLLALAINYPYYRMIFLAFSVAICLFFSSENNILLGSVFNFSNMFLAFCSISGYFPSSHLEENEFVPGSWII